MLSVESRCKCWNNSQLAPQSHRKPLVAVRLLLPIHHKHPIATITLCVKSAAARPPYAAELDAARKTVQTVFDKANCLLGSTPSGRKWTA